MKSSKHHHEAIPDRKISETFLDFASPVLSMMPDDATEANIETALQIAFTVWNSVIFDEVDGNDHYIAWLRDLISDDPIGNSLVTKLIDRKRTTFAEDRRVIGNYKIRCKHGELNLWAEARNPCPSK